MLFGAIGRFAVFLFLLFLGEAVWANQSYYTHQSFLSPRVMGMGGAFTALADDYSALYFNPAGLGKLASSQANFSILTEMTTNPSPLGIANDLSHAGGSAGTMAATLSNSYGSHFGSRVNLNGTWARPGWAFGVSLADVTIEGDISGAGGGDLALTTFVDTTFQVAYAGAFGDDKSFSIGIAPKAVYRGYVNEDLLVLNLVTNPNFFRPQDLQEGLAVDADFGILYNIPTPKDLWFKPSVGLAVHNIIDGGFATSFHLIPGGQSGLPAQKLERRVDIGTRFDLPEFWVYKPRVMIDCHDMGSNYASFKKCLGIGAEFAWKAWGWLQGSYSVGYGQGYVTAGVNLEMAIFRAEFATYSEEVGSTSAPQESRRIAMRLSLDF